MLRRFPYRIIVQWSDVDECYVARLPSLLNIFGHGNTAAEAVTEVQIAATAICRAIGEAAPPSDL